MIYLVDKLSSLTKSATRYGKLHICKRLDLGLILMIFLLHFVITGESLYFFGQGPQPRLNSEVKGILRILTSMFNSPASMPVSSPIPWIFSSRF